MKYIKLILVTVIITSAAGFVIWHLMWMTEVEKKFRTVQSSGAVNITEVQGKKNKNQRGKTEKTVPAAEERTAPVQDSRTQTDQTGTTPQETVNQADSKDAHDTKQTVTETKERSAQETGKWFKKDIGLGRKVRQGKPEPGKTVAEISTDKNMPVTIKNKANPVMQKDITHPQPVKSPDVHVPAITPYPTSTAP